MFCETIPIIAWILELMGILFIIALGIAIKNYITLMKTQKNVPTIAELQKKISKKK